MRHLFAKLTASSPASTSLALLLLRLTAGGFMAVGHGFGKLKTDPSTFPDPLGIGASASYYGAVTSELVCAGLVAIGLLTRLACLPCIFTMAVGALVVHGKDPFFAGGPGDAKEPAVIYLLMFTVILIAGPGRYSLDPLIAGRSVRDARPRGMLRG